jgi:hypothetical protein
MRGFDQSVRVRDIGLRGGGERACAFHIAARGGQAFEPTRNQSDAPAMTREQSGGAPADAGGASRDDDDARTAQ